MLCYVLGLKWKYMLFPFKWNCYFFRLSFLRPTLVCAPHRHKRKRPQQSTYYGRYVVPRNLWTCPSIPYGKMRSTSYTENAHSAHWEPSRIRAYFNLFWGREVPKSTFARFGSISECRTHKYHQIAYNFETNPMGPVPGSETQITRKTNYFFLLGVWMSRLLYAHSA